VNSTWLFPAVEAIHLLALTALLGTVVILSLRLLGVAPGHMSIQRTARNFAPYTWGAIGITGASGFLLFLTAGLKYWNSPVFRVKMMFLLVAAIFQSSVMRRIARADQPEVARRSARFTGAALLILWFGVAAAGRALGFLA
jgi:hypothetical protein